MEFSDDSPSSRCHRRVGFPRFGFRPMLRTSPNLDRSSHRLRTDKHFRRIVLRSVVQLAQCPSRARFASGARDSRTEYSWSAFAPIIVHDEFPSSRWFRRPKCYGLSDWDSCTSLGPTLCPERGDNPTWSSVDCYRVAACGCGTSTVPGIGSMQPDR